MLDANLWTSTFARFVRNILTVGVVAAFAVACVFTAEDFPYVPLCLFIMLYPYWVLAVRGMFDAVTWMTCNRIKTIEWCVDTSRRALASSVFFPSSPLFRDDERRGV